ncbi:hypothetical protein AGMMS49953_10270 [Endomicrobiia bacterium]|nr:hypothetical protein AGMMS49953_10270 [Endomicrobiia bacterium]
MSDKIGPMALQRPNEEVFLGRDISRDARHSGKTSELIDEEVKNIIYSSKSRASKIIKDNVSILNKIVSYLLERENLSGEDIDKIIKGEELAPLSESSSVDEETKKKSAVEKKVINEKVITS